MNRDPSPSEQSSVLCNLRAALRALESPTRPSRVIVENVDAPVVAIAISCELGRHTLYSWETFIYCPRLHGGRLAARKRLLAACTRS